MGQESETKKSQLVLEICSLSTLSIACVHRHHGTSDPVESHFTDWYRVLRVEENADIEVVKRSYHKLALQLHPDKNRHPKAEIAFKLVLEAYSCLSDNAKRRAFDFERSKNFCIKCKRIPYATKLKESSPANRSRILLRERIKEMKQRFKEEIQVMENCLKASTSSTSLRKETPVFKPPLSEFCFQSKTSCGGIEKESPIFDPSNYVIEGYPHARNKIFRKNTDNIWQVQGQTRGRRYGYPVFDNYRTDEGILKSKSSCVYS